MKANNSRRFEYVVIGAYALLHAVLLFFHEPWRDEAQAWLIARDLDFAGILRQMAYEGTPALWHFLLAPFAKAGFPYATEGILHLLIATSAVFVFMLRAPFPRFMKTAFVFSYFMSFEYAVFARNYSVSALLLFLIAAAYEARFSRPKTYGALVALLANTNVHSLVIAAALGSAYLFETFKSYQTREILPPNFVTKVGGQNDTKRQLYALSVMLIGGLFAAWQVLPAADGAYRGAAQFFNLGAFPVAFRVALIPVTAFSSAFWNVAALVFFAAALYFARRQRAALWIFFFSSVGLLYIFTFRYVAQVRHFGLILLILLFILWIAYPVLEKRRLVAAALAVFFLAAAPKTVSSLWSDVCCSFSESRDMAAYIRDYRPEGLIAAHPLPEAVSLLPYLPGREFWYIGIGKKGTFVTWDEEWMTSEYFSLQDIMTRLDRAFPLDGARPLLLLNRPLDFLEARGYALLHASDDIVYGHAGGESQAERYYLYEPIQ